MPDEKPFTLLEPILAAMAGIGMARCLLGGTRATLVDERSVQPESDVCVFLDDASTRCFHLYKDMMRTLMEHGVLDGVTPEMMCEDVAALVTGCGFLTPEQRAKTYADMMHRVHEHAKRY